MTSRGDGVLNGAVIMIAHRLKTVQKAERIFALENGKPHSREYMKNL